MQAFFRGIKFRYRDFIFRDGTRGMPQEIRWMSRGWRRYEKSNGLQEDSDSTRNPMDLKWMEMPQEIQWITRGQPGWIARGQSGWNE